MTLHRTQKQTIRTIAFTLLSFVSVAALAQNTPPAQNAPGVPPSSNTASDTPTAGAAGTIVSPKVFFIEPKDGATVPQEFTVKFGLSGMKIAPAGKIVPGTGHHHLIIDGAASKKDEVVGMDATHLHFGKGQTETKLKLAPGKHTLTLQFADGAHRSYGEAMSATITVNVK